MAVQATIREPLSMTPSMIRYSFSLASNAKGSLNLQRAEKLGDGTWIDDPRPEARKTVPMPDEAAAIIAPLLPVVLGVTTTVSEYRLQCQSRLSNTGSLDVLLMIQANIGSWISRLIPSLTVFLSQNPNLAQTIGAAWDELDAVIGAANAKEGWL